MIDHVKCSPKHDGYASTICNALRDAVDFHPTKRSRGIYSANITNIETMESVGTRITVHSGDFIGNGIVANYCPFCGGALRDMSNDGDRFSEKAE